MARSSGLSATACTLYPLPSTPSSGSSATACTLYPLPSTPSSGSSATAHVARGHERVQGTGHVHEHEWTRRKETASAAAASSTAEAAPARPPCTLHPAPCTLVPARPPPRQPPMLLGAVAWRTPPFVQKELISYAFGGSNDSGPGQLYVEPGCGNAKVMIAVAQAAACRCVGYEVNAEAHAEAVANVAAAGLAHMVSVRLESAAGDRGRADLCKADVVYIFSNTLGLRRLAPTLHSLKPGCRLVTYLYDFKEKTWADADRTTRCVVRCAQPGQSGVSWPLFCYTLATADPESV
mgnify:CR=1 FL=1